MQKSNDPEDDEIKKMLGDFAAKLESFAGSVSGSTSANALSEPFPFSRRITIVAGARLNKQKLCALADIYAQDATFAQRLLAKLNNDPDANMDPPRLQALNRCAIRELVEDSTDMFAESLLLAERGVGPHEIVSLFEDIYATGIRAPNQAELGLLSRITDFEVDQIEAFFAWKREKLYHYELVNALGDGKSPAAAFLRKQQFLETQRRPVKKDLTLN